MKLLFATNFLNDIGADTKRVDVKSTGTSTLTKTVSSSGLTISQTLQPGDKISITPGIRIKSAAPTYQVKLELPTLDNFSINLFGVEITNGKVNGISLPTGQVQLLVVQDGLTKTLYVNSVLALSEVPIGGPASIAENVFEIENSGTSNALFYTTIKEFIVMENPESEIFLYNITEQDPTEISSNWSFSGNSLIESLDKDNPLSGTPNASGYTDRVSKFKLGLNPNVFSYIESAGYLEGSTSGTLIVNNSILLPQCTEQSALDTVILGKVQELEVQRVKRAMIVRVESLDVTSVTVRSANSDLVIGFTGFETTLIGSSTKSIQVPNGSNLLYISGFAQELEIAGTGITEVLDFGDLEASRIAFSSSNLTSPNLVLVPSELPESITSIEDMFRGSSSFTGRAASGLTGCSGVLESTIADWVVSGITNMDNAFNGTNLNVDLSTWDVEHIPTKPDGFDFGVTSPDYKEPRWGEYLPPFKSIIEPTASTTLYVDVVDPGGMIIDWGDGSAPQNVTGNITHTYSSAGIYEVKINGKCSELIFSHPDLTEVLDFGETGASRIAFYKSGQESIRLTKVPDELPTSITSTYQMFRNCSAFNQPLNFDTSNVTDMYGMFRNCSAFNQPLNWDTSNVTNMSWMFYDCSAFNQPLNFDTSNVTSMGSMFSACRVFNQPLNFNTSNVTSMNLMFFGCNRFNQDLSGWCVQKIPSKPTNFDTGTPSGFNTSRQPRWGQAC